MAAAIAYRRWNYIVQSLDLSLLTRADIHIYIYTFDLLIGMQYVKREAVR